MLGLNLFPYEMLSPKLYTVLSAKELDCSGKENFDISYAYLGKLCKHTFTEDDFVNYCQ